MRSLFKLALTCILTVNIQAFRLGILSDIHIGEGCISPYNYDENCYSVQTARRTVNYINANLTSDIDLIIITGDITGSGQRTQYEKAYEILRGLTVPWIPLIGNHDTWPYSDTWEHSTADGDAYFGEIFGSHIRSSKYVTDYPNVTAFDPNHGFNQTPQNIEITINLGKTDAVIFGGDFNTRMHALIGNKGNLGQADLNDFPGGAMDWLRHRLQAQRPRNVSLAFLAQHQPLKCPWYIPNFGFCFSNTDQDYLREAFRKSNIADSAFWGTFAGHIHEWGWYDTIFQKDGKGFQTFHQLQISGCKGNQITTDINGAISIVPFNENGVDIHGIERIWHDNNFNAWFSSYGPPTLATEREVHLHQVLSERQFKE